MSGGSYDYASLVDELDEVLAKRGELEALGERLIDLSEDQFPGSTAAGERTLALLAWVQLWEAHVRAQTSVLRETWKAVEWWSSGDYGPDEVRDALMRMLAPEVPS